MAYLGAFWGRKRGFVVRTNKIISYKHLIISLYREILIIRLF